VKIAFCFWFLLSQWWVIISGRFSLYWCQYVCIELKSSTNIWFELCKETLSISEINYCWLNLAFHSWLLTEAKFLLPVVIRVIHNLFVTKKWKFVQTLFCRIWNLLTNAFLLLICEFYIMLSNRVSKLIQAYLVIG